MTRNGMAHDLTAVSLFSGVGGLDEGLRRAGFRHLLMCEGGGDPNGTKAEREQYKQGVYRRAVLRARFPGVPIADDVRSVGDIHVRLAGGRRERQDVGGKVADMGGGQTRRADPAITSEQDARGLRPDLVCGGFPCQDLSVAGQRAGLAGERSGLFHEYARIADALQPRWLLVENVPGLLSSNGGRDFGIVLGTLAELGYGLAWRILDSRYFGVPQRRRRVFIVGARADGHPRAAAERAGQVLAVGSRCRRHPPAGGEAGSDVAVASLSGLDTGGPDDNDGQGGRSIAETLRSHPRPGSNSSGNLVAPSLVKRYGKGTDSDATDALVTAFHQTPMPIHGDDFSPAIGATSIGMGVGIGPSVRRLTPTECERLQAFPDGWTNLGGTPDSKRYAALGDAVTVTVAEWLGRRIAAA